VVSAAVRHIYIYMSLGFNRLITWNIANLTFHVYRQLLISYRQDIMKCSEQSCAPPIYFLYNIIVSGRYFYITNIKLSLQYQFQVNKFDNNINRISIPFLLSQYISAPKSHNSHGRWIHSYMYDETDHIDTLVFLKTVAMFETVILYISPC